MKIDMILTAHTSAPDFELFATPDKKVKLSSFRGKKVILSFYPADWSPVCSDQLAVYNETLKYFQAAGAQLLGISVDSKWSHRAFSEDRHLHFPLLADFEPKGAVAKQYGVYDEQRGAAQRALFVIDEKGIIQWSYLSPNDVNPGADGILEALDTLNNVNC
ncbi:peroxiredoxin [Chitinophaga sp.]|uniref:peroxiredoxin n=1 Tax=Chitinophaga sp. TaxID=1869181 RepID=UPI0025BA9816|nr:peroxiredoxin [Chitinophaga sp.]